MLFHQIIIRSLTVFFLFFMPFWLPAQEEWLSQEANAQEEDGLLQQLSLYAENPLKINQVSQEELLEFPFFTPQQCLHIWTYLQRNGPIQSKAEFFLIPGFNATFIDQFWEYLSLETKVKKNYTVKSTVRLGITINKEEAGELISQVNDPTLGSSERSYVQAKIHAIHPNLSMGFSYLKNYGEPYWASSSSKGIKGTLVYQEDQGILKQLLIGGISAKMGSGLIFNPNAIYSGNTFSKGLTKDHAIKADWAVSNRSAINGMGAVLKKGPIQTLIIFGKKGYAAEMKYKEKETLITSFSEYRYGSTVKEVQNGTGVFANILGASVQYQRSKLNLSYQAVKTQFNVNVMPDSSYYNTYYLRGKDFLNHGLQGKFLLGNHYLFGELASNKKALAALIGARGTLDELIDYEANFVWLSKNYSAPLGNVGQRGKNLNNFKQLQINLTAVCSKALNLQLGTIFKKADEMRYGYFSPSTEWRIQMNLTTALSDRLQIHFRYVFLDQTASKNILHSYVQQHSLRGNGSFIFNEEWSLEAQTAFTRLSSAPAQLGKLFFIGLVKRGQILSWRIRAVRYQVKDYEGRFYTYDPSLSNQFSFESFYGDGTYFTGLLKIGLKTLGKLELKASLKAFEYNELMQKKRTKIFLQYVFNW